MEVSLELWILGKEGDDLVLGLRFLFDTKTRRSCFGFLLHLACCA